ncbi:BfmA/BtgA family mobilization protein [uncultured Algibacter sp.]|uniref:BfmA/BtgA family mobilization protein n=1 Tax=uncultured Algibacter sp. TaxID=298659 RepID=UPI0026179612|nr:BfmA/BtgA family mobilization protein [uncultured Algibacter sp.]
MDKGYEKERFESLSIKSSVAHKFRKYCKTISKSQSMTLYHMINFFELNGVSPQDNLGDSITSLKGQIIKRSNAIIAIIKSIEKMHHKPTTLILKTLFEETAKMESIEEDTFNFGTPKLITEREELEYYQKAYHKSQKDYTNLKQDTTDLLKTLKYVRNNFGVGHYRLDVNKESMKQFKKKLEHVHEYNTPENRS